MITCNFTEGRYYYTAIARGVRYTAYESPIGWQVLTNRLALGHRNPPGVKHFQTVEEVARNVKALAGLDHLVMSNSKVLTRN